MNQHVGDFWRFWLPNFVCLLIEEAPESHIKGIDLPIVLSADGNFTIILVNSAAIQSCIILAN